MLLRDRWVTDGLRERRCKSSSRDPNGELDEGVTGSRVRVRPLLPGRNHHRASRMPRATPATPPQPRARPGGTVFATCSGWLGWPAEEVCVGEALYPCGIPYGDRPLLRRMQRQSAVTGYERPCDIAIKSSVGNRTTAR